MSQSQQFNRELLAGYADAELSAAERQCVEAWLREHPEVGAELEAQRAWGRKTAAAMYESVSLPSDSAWHRTLTKVRSALEPARPVSYDTTATLPKRRRLWQVPASVAAIAAGLLIAIALTPPHIGPDGLVDANREALVVASPADVEVIALQGDDSMVVIGEPLLRDRLEMATIGDVSLDAIVGDADVFGPRHPQTPADLKKPLLIVPSEKTQPVP